MRKVEIASGKTNVQLPNGFAYKAGDQVTLTDEQFRLIPSGLFSGTVIDRGRQVTEGDAVVTASANVAAPVALTSSAPAALTSSAPAALTSVAATGGEPPTEAEFNALQADVAALRTTLAAAQADVAALRTTLTAVRTDLSTLRTSHANLLAALKGTGKVMTPD